MNREGVPDHPAVKAGAGTFKKADRYRNYADEDDKAWLRIEGTYRLWRPPSPAALSRVQHAFAYPDRFEVYGYDTGEDEIPTACIESK